MKEYIVCCRGVPQLWGLSGTYCHKTGARPPSCGTPQQLTIYKEYLKKIPTKKPSTNLQQQIITSTNPITETTNTKKNYTNTPGQLHEKLNNNPEPFSAIPCNDIIACYMCHHRSTCNRMAVQTRVFSTNFFDFPF